jgi:benzoate-CoA ligase family protein
LAYGPNLKRENFPSTCDIPEYFNISTLHVDEHIAQGKGNKVAIITPSRRLTYLDVQEKVNKAGNFLIETGVVRNSSILLLVPDSAETVEFFIASVKIGAVPAIANPSSSLEDIDYFVKSASCKFIVTTKSTAKMLQNVQSISRLSRIITIDGSAENCTDYSSRADAMSDRLYPCDTRSDDAAYLVFSSGATGKPKVVLHLHRDLLFTVFVTLKHVISASAHDIYYSASRLFFSAGRVFSVHLPLMSGASTVLIPEKPSPEIISRTLAKYRPTLFLAIPSIYNALIKAVETDGLKIDTSSLRLCLSGGEPLPPTVYNKWKRMTHVELLNGVGSSEAEWHFISQFVGKIRPESSGLVIPGWQVKLVNQRGKEIRQPYVIGTAWIRSNSIARGYLNDPKESKRKFVDGWFNTGDTFYFDKDGYFYFTGREDNLFKVRGRWVSPTEVERVLLEHPAVAECSVFGMQDRDELTRVFAFVVLVPGHKEPEQVENELINHVASILPPYKVPHKIAFLDNLPRTGNGKIQLTRLKEMASTMFKKP